MNYGQQYQGNGYGAYIPQMNQNAYNYVPNGYQNMNPSYQYQQPQQAYMSSQQNTQPSLIKGKIVESIDILKVTEVPIGESLTCPKADFSEVYVKSWNPNGTTKIVTYRPVDENAEAPKEEVKMQDILDRIAELDSKMDKFTQELSSKRKTS